MPEIKLNKPLYEEKNPTPDATAEKARQPRPPRPSALARLGAAVIDLLALHFVGLAILRFVPDPVIMLGPSAPWIGLLAGWLYFGIGASAITGGRTLGKVILQLRTVDVTGPDLPVGKALWRATLILWPLAVFLAADRVGEALDRPDQLSLWPMLGRLASAAVFGWWLGNLFFAGLDPHGRALWDRLAGAIVITSDCAADALGDFMRSARTQAEAPAPRRAVVVLALTFFLCVGLFAVLFWSESKRLATLPDDERERLIAQKQSLYVEGFGQPTPLGSPREAVDTETSVALFQYRRRGPVNVEALRANPDAMAKAKTIAEVSVREILRALAKESIPLTLIPPKVRFEVSFASYCDLLFAWDAVDMLTISHTVALRDAVTSGTIPTSAPTKPTRADLTQPNATETSAPLSDIVTTGTPTMEKDQATSPAAGGE